MQDRGTRVPHAAQPSAGARCARVCGFRIRFRNIAAPTVRWMRVLIAEDELYLAEALQTGLRREAIAADIALDGDAALDRLAVNDYDVARARPRPARHARRRGGRRPSPASTPRSASSC